ncbi:MAG: DUF5317 family protein [Coriobacteriia bacterium]|nr:DUF5317 family protein [Coriobacteriia bacterium]
MTLFLDALLLGCAAGLVAGGSIRRIGSTRLRFESLLLVLFILQLALPRIATMVGMSKELAVYSWLLVMLALVVIALLNHPQAGLLLVSLGIGLNALVIALNGAMPVSERAVSVIVGHEYVMNSEDTDVLHEPIRPSTVAAPLSDVIPLPGPTWHRGIISVGDVLLCGGVAWFICDAMVCSERRSSSDHMQENG